MVKITDTIEIHDGVALMIGRHDSAKGPNLDAVGGMYAYAMGKFAPEYFRIDPPEYIVHSPVSRARNTAKMHRIAQGVTTGNFPDIAYDERLHEQAKDEYKLKVAQDAIGEAQFRGYKTIEIVTHSNSPLEIARRLGGNDSGSLDYGGMVVLKADSWEDMIDPNIQKQTEMVGSSKEMVKKVLGQTQVDILDYFSGRISIEQLKTNPEIEVIFDKAKREYEPSESDKIFPDDQYLINALVSAKQEETKEWAIKAIKGEDVESVFRPDEFMEIYDAYRYWVQNMALVIGLEPLDKDSLLQSNLMEKLNPLENKARGFIDSYLVTEEGDGLHPILNAYVNKLEDGKFSARKADILAKSQSVGLTVPGYTDAMEAEKLAPKVKENMERETSHHDDDHPLLYALLAARMKKNGGKI